MNSYDTQLVQHDYLACPVQGLTGHLCAVCADAILYEAIHSEYELQLERRAYGTS